MGVMTVEASKLNVLLGSALIFALLAMYMGSLQINQLARDRYLYKDVHSRAKRAFTDDTQIGFRQRAKVHTRVIDAKLDRLYKNETNSTIEFIYQYNYFQKPNQTVMVHVDAGNASRSHPVLFVVRQQRGVLSWQLPLLLDTVSGIQEYTGTSRTLCPEENIDLFRGNTNGNENGTEQSFFLGVSTSDPDNVSVNVFVSSVPKFQVELDDDRTIFVSASEPKYFQFQFPPGVSNVLLTVTSPDEICMSVSIQNISCPVFDMDREFKYDGLWQTMMNKTGMTVNRDHFPHGFYIIFIAKADDYECTGKRSLPPATRIKTVRFNVKEKVSYVNFMVSVIGLLGVFALFYIFAFFTYCFPCTGDGIAELEPSLLEAQDQQRTRPRGYGSIGNLAIDVAATMPPQVHSDSLQRAQSDSSLDMTDIDLLPDAFVDKDVVRTKTFLFVPDLSRKGPKFHSKNSHLYMWNLLIVAIFYALPVVQLVVIYQKVLNDTGNQDLCYYNFLCAHPLGELTDFNHVYSNLGYVLLGLLFIVNTARRDVLHRLARQRRSRLEKYYGIPQHYGLFYAMGTALMVEGVLSACYHICPTHANYQFDTTFMYVIAMLCMLKIYQTRHPDINAEAHAAFAVLAFVVLLGVISVFEDSIYFRVVFTVLHLSACLALSAQVYYMGRWKLNLGIFKRMYLVCWNDFQAGPRNWFRPMYVDRMFLLLIGNLANVGLAVYGLVERPPDFASYVLAIFITNLLLYTTFYIIMKLRHKERISLQPFLYILLASCSWGSSMYFFINKAASWRKRAAESRIYNQECLLLNFYDSHDIWHFLSAISLFFSFMTLLTLDDDLTYTPRDRIPVF